MSSFLESSISPNVISSMLKFSNTPKKQKPKLKPLTGLTIEQVRLKYLNPKSKTKNSDIILPKIEQKENLKILKRNENNKDNAIMVDFSRHTNGSNGEFKSCLNKKTLPFLDSKTRSTISATFYHSENLMEKKFTISIENFDLSKNFVNSKNKLLYKMEQDNQNSDGKITENLQTNFRLQRLENSLYNSKDKLDENKLKFKPRKKNSRLKKIAKNKSKDSESARLKSNEKIDGILMTRVDSPHLLRKSIPDSYKFMAHSSACLGITSRDLIEQFEFYQSNNFSNDSKN